MMDSLLLLNLSLRMNELGEFCFRGRALWGYPYRLRMSPYSNLTLGLVLTLLLACCSRPEPTPKNTFSPHPSQWTEPEASSLLPGRPHAWPTRTPLYTATSACEFFPNWTLQVLKMVTESGTGSSAESHYT